MRLALAVAFLAVTIVAGAPRLYETATLAYHLARVPDLETRRLTVFGPWYAGVQRLRRETPPDATIDFVLLRPEARGIAVLAATELLPRDVRLFEGWEAWKRRERATLLRDARAANAVGSPPGPAQFVVTVDQDFQWSR